MGPLCGLDKGVSGSPQFLSSPPCRTRGSPAPPVGWGPLSPLQGRVWCGEGALGFSRDEPLPTFWGLISGFCEEHRGGLCARPRIVSEGLKPRTPKGEGQWGGARAPHRTRRVWAALWGQLWGVIVPSPARWLHHRGVGASAQPLPHPLPCCGPPKRGGGGAVGAAAALPRAQRPAGALGGLGGGSPPNLCSSERRDQPPQRGEWGASPLCVFEAGRGLRPKPLWGSCEGVPRFLGVDLGGALGVSLCLQLLLLVGRPHCWLSPFGEHLGGSSAPPPAVSHRCFGGHFGGLPPLCAPGAPTGAEG